MDDSTDPVSGVDFRSRSEERIAVTEVPMLTPAELVRLPKGQAFALLAGGRLWKLRIPRPVDKERTPLPDSVERNSPGKDSRCALEEDSPAGPVDGMECSEAQTVSEAESVSETGEGSGVDG